LKARYQLKRVHYFCILNNLFSSVPKPKGKKTKDMKKSVKVPAEPQTVVGQNHICVSLVGFV
jgi:hypothetical protein